MLSSTSRLTFPIRYLTLSQTILATPQCSAFVLQNHHQVRHRKKVANVYSFEKVGADPIITEEEYKNAQDNNLFEDLKYKKIRFALKQKTSSVFYDSDVLRFENEVMKKGKRYLAQRLFNSTMYELKCIRLTKLRKMREAEEKKAEKETKADVNESVVNSSGISESKVVESKQNSNNNDVKQSEQEKEKFETNPMIIFKEALSNCEPSLIAKPVKRGGATYQVPHPLIETQSQWYALKWFVRAVRERPKPRTKPFYTVCARELIDAFNNEGKVIKIKEDVHKLCEANRTFAHYRWG